MSASDCRVARRTAALLLAGVAFAAHAQEDRRELQARRLQQRVQQLQQEQAGQQAELQRAKQEKSNLEAALEKARSEAGNTRGAARQAAGLKAQLEAVGGEREALKVALAKAQAERDEAQAQLAQQKATLDEMRGSLKAWGQQVTALQTLTRSQSGLLRSCSANNDALVKLGHELLGRYEHKGLGETLASQEPFLQTRRVALEQYGQDTREQIRRAAFDPLSADATK